MADKKIKNKILISLGALMAFAGIAYISYTQGLWRFNYPSLKQCLTQGLDISHHQGQINWAAIDKSKFKFVYIKATEGGDHQDQKFAENLQHARQNNLEIGAYHFFTLCRDGTEQAQNFISNVATDANDLPPAIDLEYVGNCSARPEKEEFLKNLDSFSSTIEQKYRQKPLIYTTRQFFVDYIQGTKYASYPLWVRDTFKYPDKKNFPLWKIWQYADNARIKGIIGPVDLNCFGTN